MNSATTADATVPIYPLYSGVFVELTDVEISKGPFGDPDDPEETDLVFVVIAEIAPATFAVMAKDNYHYWLGQGNRRVRSLFIEEIDEKMCMSVEVSKLIISLNIDGYRRWAQFKFEYDTEFWGFLNAVTQIRNTQVNRRLLVDQQTRRLADDFLSFFKPTVAPYDNPKEIERLRRKEEKSAARGIEQDEESRNGRTLKVDEYEWLSATSN
ncbi:hypothetical protein C8T65DRAFT_745289 [Cerioporus squamosus]|nr:hypothetical protein C8T65DRAFT_745289 [Cerioporus squamosus]